MVRGLRDGLEPPRWAVIKDGLWLYGDRTLRRWFRTPRELQEACARSNVPSTGLRAEDYFTLRRSGDARTDLATGVLLNAMPKFEQALRTSTKGTTGYWDPEKGRSLPSFFLGRCAQEVPGVARPWSDERSSKAWSRTRDLDDQAWEALPAGVDVERVADLRGATQALWLHANDRQRAVLVLLWQGYSAVDAAEELQVTARTVEGRVRQLRLRAQKLGLNPWAAAS